jgi:hypothetical protein
LISLIEGVLILIILVVGCLLLFFLTLPFLASWLPFLLEPSLLDSPVLRV